MARIRTIKPEFWTSEQVVECSPMARLLFVGLWNFCDDAGRHPASSRRLKMEVFPSDSFTCEQINEWIAELVKVGLLISYTVAGQDFWQVTGWHHQKIDRPTVRFPEPPKPHEFGEQSAISRRAVGESSPPESSGTGTGTGMESKGREGSLKTGRAGVFGRITEELLRDDGALSRWHTFAANQKRPVVGNSERDRLNVFCAAERALQIGENPPAVFVSLVSNGKWDFITQAQEDRAVARLKALHNRGAPSSLAAELAAKLSATATD